jgi:hypothetical protein
MVSKVAYKVEHDADHCEWSVEVSIRLAEASTHPDDRNFWKTQARYWKMRLLNIRSKN